jgi:TPR repeat protein
MLDGRALVPGANFGSPFVPCLRFCRAALVAAPVLLTLTMAPAFAGIEAGAKAVQANDMPTAEKELQPLAKERDPRAQFLLGLYVYGNPNSKLFDLTKGAPLLLDAAERGYALAMIPLAGAYLDGKGVPKSAYDAFKWLLIAERWNVPNASQLLDQISKELKPEEVEKAKAEAVAFTFKTK